MRCGGLGGDFYEERAVGIDEFFGLVVGVVFGKHFVACAATNLYQLFGLVDDIAEAFEECCGGVSEEHLLAGFCFDAFQTEAGRDDSPSEGHAFEDFGSHPTAGKKWNHHHGVLIDERSGIRDFAMKVHALPFALQKGRWHIPTGHMKFDFESFNLCGLPDMLEEEKEPLLVRHPVE